MILLLFTGLFLTGVSVALGARALTSRRSNVRAGVAQITTYGFRSISYAAADRTRAAFRSNAGIDVVAGMVGDAVIRRLRSFSDEQLRTQLMGAGFYGLSSRKFMGYRALAAVALPLFWLWVAVITHAAPPLIVMGLATAFVFGWLGPMAFLKRRTRSRLERIDYEMPELIDLLVVLIEAGTSFVRALQLGASRFGGPLGEELKFVLHEQNLGISTNDALTNMLARCDTPAIRSFVRSITQGQTLGVSMGQIIRGLSVEMRKRRRAAAEERAQKAPVKILFPLVFLILPAVFVVLLGPAAFDVVRSLGSH